MILNPATLLLFADHDRDDEMEYDHDCIDVTQLCTKPRPDIRESHIADSNVILFVDGSCLRDNQNVLRAAYSVCTLSDIIEASFLYSVPSVAEIIALTRACQISQDLKVTVYTIWFQNCSGLWSDLEAERFSYFHRNSN